MSCYLCIQLYITSFTIKRNHFIGLPHSFIHLQISIFADLDKLKTVELLSTRSVDYSAVQEGKDAVVLVVERTGGRLVSRQVEFYVEPEGDAEFWGSRGVLTFHAGESALDLTITARSDGIPEVRVPHAHVFSNAGVFIYLLEIFFFNHRFNRVEISYVS